MHDQAAEHTPKEKVAVKFGKFPLTPASWTATATSSPLAAHLTTLLLSIQHAINCTYNRPVRESQLKASSGVSHDIHLQILVVLLNSLGCDSPGIFRSGSLMTIIVLSRSQGHGLSLP